MTRSLFTRRARWSFVFTILFLAGNLLPLCVKAEAGPCNFSVNLFLMKGGDGTPIVKYSLGIDAIPLFMVVRNEAQWPVNTELGFSQLEADQFLIVTDPIGNRHLPVIREVLAPDDMPPLMTFNNWEIAPAEAVPTGWKRSVQIEDLRVLFPAMKELGGWYTIEAELPETCFGWTVRTAQGLMGVLDNNAFQGTMKSNQIKIFVSPASGARLKIRVKDLNTPENPYKEQVPVKIFKDSDIPEEFSLEDAWEKSVTIAAGKTDFQGWVVTECLPEPVDQDSYRAVARYSGEYKETRFAPGGGGWMPNCGGLITGEIVFGQVFEWPISDFSLVAWNSIFINDNSIVNSGNIGTLNASPGPWLNSNAEVSLASNVLVKDGVRIYGDSVRIGSNSSVWEVYYNELANKGIIRREAKQGLSLPLPIGIPAFNASTPGKTDVTVKTNQTMTLGAGGYRNVVIQKNATLRLSGGAYDFDNLTFQANAKLIFLNKTQIRIKNRLATSDNVQIGPSGSNLGAKDLILYIGGINGTDGALASTPKAAALGKNNIINANLYVPNGTLFVNDNGVMKGSFLAKDISFGKNNIVTLESGF